jgi:hypothetical protein
MHIVLPGGQRSKYIVHVQVYICRKPSNIWGNYKIQIYTSNKDIVFSVLRNEVWTSLFFSKLRFGRKTNCSRLSPLTALMVVVV